jgi:radical SAM superfamily enzyme YgiQ (UPF0313 family)
MRYEGTVYRPPSEAASFILQATIGCSYNRCTYCAMYQDKRFSQRSREDLREDMVLAQGYHGAEAVRRVFLADGDALIMRTARLLEILEDLKEHFPNFERASVYSSPQALLGKSVEDIAALRQAGLPLHYAGPETGHPVVMERIKKGVTPEQFEEGARRVIDAGAKLSVIFLLGIGGVELSEEHAVASAEWCNRVQPRFVSTLTLTPVPGTPIHDQIQRGELVLPDPRGILRELRTFVAHLDGSKMIFRSNHASNALPIGGTLPRDKGRLLAVLDGVIADESMPLRPPPSPHSL